MNLEGKYYLVNWSIENKTHVLELKSKKRLTARSSDLNEAKDDLCSQITLMNGDGEAHLELLPKFEDKSMWSVLVPTKELVLKSDLNGVFSSSICGICHYGVGSRTDIQLESINKPTDAVCVFRNIKPWVTIYSKKLLDNLSVLTGKEFLKRDVLYKGELSGFFEVLNTANVRYKSLISEPVDVKANTTFHCTGCGRRSFQVSLSKQLGSAYIDKNELCKEGMDYVETSSVTGTRIAIRSDFLTRLPRKSKLERIVSANLVLLEKQMLEVPFNLPSL